MVHSQLQVIKFTSCLLCLMVGGSLQVLRLLPLLKLVAMILLKVALNTINVIKSIFASYTCHFVFFPKLPEKRSCMLPKYDKTRVDTNFIHLVLILTDFYRTEGVFTSNVTLFNEFQIHWCIFIVFHRKLVIKLVRSLLLSVNDRVWS
jgi:hypothetical protein